MSVSPRNNVGWVKWSVASARRTARTRRCTHGIGEGFLGGAMLMLPPGSLGSPGSLCGRVPVGWCLLETRVVLAIQVKGD